MTGVTRLIEPVRTAPVATPVSPASRRVGWAFVLLTALAVVAFSAVPYFTASLRELAGDEVGLAPTYAEAPMFVQALRRHGHLPGGPMRRILRPRQAREAVAPKCGRRIVSGRSSDYSMRRCFIA